MRFVHEIGNDSGHEDLQGIWDGEFATIYFGLDMAVRVEIGKYALFTLADCVVEFMHQQSYIAQGDAATFTSTGNEHHFPGAQYFVMEQRAAYPCVSATAKYQIVDFVSSL
ncbi:hypothetical protein [Parabacteroides bouchesdurhonensis]|uniref:hypothetical protein n=1 Tax=Parabacteroides bouchesdurhonensis TaxID=1936995 RepID=UPI001F487594|nr:hypothetical protein [Parabacteroides bouchesdurhonensis]